MINKNAILNIAVPENGSPDSYAAWLNKVCAGYALQTQGKRETDSALETQMAVQWTNASNRLQGQDEKREPTMTDIAREVLRATEFEIDAYNQRYTLVMEAHTRRTSFSAQALQSPAAFEGINPDNDAAPALPAPPKLDKAA